MEVQRANDFVLPKLARGYYTFPVKEAENAVGTGMKTWESVDRLAK